MLTCALQSGSNGNCIYVETGDARLLFDAGISAKTAAARLGIHGRTMGEAEALIISHNHWDHVSGAGVFARRFGMPVYMSQRAWQGSAAKLGQIGSIRHFVPGECLRFGATTVQTIRTAHDGVDGAAFVVEHGGKRLGIFTDLGHRFAGIEDWIEGLDGLYVESNYDPAMLASGPYPKWLQRRISGNGGHLSNAEAAGLVKDCGRRLQRVVLAHLSEQNNRPELALGTMEAAVGGQMAVALALRSGASEMFLIE